MLDNTMLNNAVDSMALLEKETINTGPLKFVQPKETLYQPVTVPYPVALNSAAVSSEMLLKTSTGVPFRWNTHLPIRVKINPHGILNSDITLLRQVISEVAELSHVPLTYSGFTTETLDNFPNTDILISLSPRPPDISLQSYATGGISQLLYEGIIIEGFMNIYPDVHHDVSSTLKVGIFRHEFGHIMNLWHVEDPYQIMNPVVYMREWGQGDVKGLEQMGGLDRPLDVCSPPSDLTCFTNGRGMANVRWNRPENTGRLKIEHYAVCLQTNYEEKYNPIYSIPTENNGFSFFVNPRHTYNVYVYAVNRMGMGLPATLKIN